METTDGTTKVVAYTWGKDSELTAADGAKVLTFTFTAPSEPGTYPVDLLYDLDLIFDGVNQKFNEMANLDGVNHDLTVVAGAVIVEGEVVDTTTTESSTTETTTTESTPVPGDGVVLTFDTVTVAPGAEATVNLVITGDPGTAGASLYFTYDSALTLGSVKAGNAYRVSAIINENMETTDGTTKVVAYTWGKDSELTAADGAKVLTFTFTAPTEPGTYPVDLLYDLDLIFDGVNQKFNEMANLDGVNHALTVVAGAVIVEGETETTTTETTTTETTTTETTTTETTTTETTTTETSTTPQPGDIFWGDVDCDQDVDIADVVRLNKFNAGNADVSEQGQLNADCEFDGKLDAADALAIKKYLAHLIPYEDLGDQ